MAEAIKNQDKVLLCNYCYTVFTNDATYCQHSLICKPKGIKTVFCSICNVQFTSKYFKSHIKLHQGNISNFSSLFAIVCYILTKIVSDSFTHVCNICTLRFNTKVKLNNHIAKIHVKDFKYLCDICQEKYSTYTDLKNHRTRKHKQNPTIFKCYFLGCDYKTNIKYSLQVHFCRHSGEKPFQCKKCPHAFSQKNSLTIHETKHHTSPYEGQLQTITDNLNQFIQLPVLTNDDLIAGNTIVK